MSVVDVAVQSYRKPHLLLYSLLSLKAHSGQHVDQVWINDDGSAPWVIEFYKSKAFQEALHPWRVHVRQNTRRMGWWYLPVKGLQPKYMTLRRRLSQWWKQRKNSDFFEAQREDIRYQWAIDSTDKDFLYLMHDDMVYYGDTLDVYLNAIQALSKPAVVGDLGQCWWCNYKEHGCTPARISSGWRPSETWPEKHPLQQGYWPCRMNEWSTLLSVRAARAIEEQEEILFGNYNNKGDVGVYWFAMANKHRFEFLDPLGTPADRAKYYLHADGNSGHSVWVDHGLGKKLYKPEIVIQMLKTNFGFECPQEFQVLEV